MCNQGGLQSRLDAVDLKAETAVLSQVERPKMVQSQDAGTRDPWTWSCLDAGPRQLRPKAA